MLFGLAMVKGFCDLLNHYQHVEGVIQIGNLSYRSNPHGTV